MTIINKLLTDMIEKKKEIKLFLLTNSLCIDNDPFGGFVMKSIEPYYVIQLLTTVKEIMFNLGLQDIDQIRSREK